ncbi:MAG TPA: hypothetical protein VGM54_02225 [Chthoniobacter sp.]|jgi:hypothetical protein
MPGLAFTNNNVQWVLCLDGSVSKMVSGQETPHQGQWSSDPLANHINLVIPKGTNFSVPVKYSFNANNQLVVAVTGGGVAQPGSPAATLIPDSAPYTFEGYIDISDNREVCYRLLDSNGNPLNDASGNPLTFLVRGDLSIDDKLAHLVVTFPDKSTTFITGLAPDGTGVNAGSNPNGNTGGGADQLTFSAVTTNSSGKIPANIVFLGSWNVSKNGIVFQASGTTGQQMALLLGGSYQGVTGGISVHQRGNTSDVAFSIQGTHQFKAPNGSGTNVNWSVGLGYSNRQVDAIVNFGAASTPANAKDKSFNINGTLQFVGGPANQAVALGLKATYDPRPDGQLVFTANVTDGSGGASYNLGLQGTYTVKGGHVTFDISVDGTAAGNTVKVDLGYLSTDGKLNAHIQAVLAKTPSGNTQVSFDFELTMQTANGILVPAGDPIPLSSSSSATAGASSAAGPAHHTAPANPKH